jgi:hypothetical protein
MKRDMANINLLYLFVLVPFFNPFNSNIQFLGPKVHFDTLSPC